VNTVNDSGSIPSKGRVLYSSLYPDPLGSHPALCAELLGLLEGKAFPIYVNGDTNCPGLFICFLSPSLLTNFSIRCYKVQSESNTSYFFLSPYVLFMRITTSPESLNAVDLNLLVAISLDRWLDHRWFQNGRHWRVVVTTHSQGRIKGRANLYGSLRRHWNNRKFGTSKLRFPHATPGITGRYEFSAQIPLYS
jgi:hypothetical protein